MKQPVRNALIALACACLAACAERPLEGPPTIRVGHDICVECGMMIAEDRCSAASLVEGPHGREYRLFDDIGCLLDWEWNRSTAGEHTEASGRDPEVVIARFVHDYGDRTWADALQAGYVDGATVVTPMASGLLGFRGSSVAEQARATFGGRVLSWADLREARRAWIDRRNRDLLGGRPAESTSSSRPADGGT
jgi:nitrous oxide reductase accessory protein NosL